MSDDLTERLTVFANDCRGSMWQSRETTISLMDEAAARIRQLETERDAAYRRGLEDAAKVAERDRGRFDTPDRIRALAPNRTGPERESDTPIDTPVSPSHPTR